MRGKEELCKRLTKELENKITTNTFSYKKEITKVCAELNNKHGIPVDQARDIFCLTKELIYESEFIIYCFCEKITPNLVTQHFDKKEIDVYQNMKIEDNSISFPIRIPAIQVAGDQWIGSITAKKLLEFNHADLINYNKNAQRTMKHVIKGDAEYYRIAINKAAIRKIKDLYLSEVYIPNTITLNIPEEDSEFRYDEDRKELVVKKIKAFDITDGYHRFVAMCDIMNTDDTFDYPMELRITNFPDSKAQQMIWQEDQKTKMRKIDSDTYNQTLFGTKVADYLNISTASNLNGLISRNGGLINASWLAACVDALWFKDKEAQDNWIQTRNSITDKLNRFTDNDPELLNRKPWSYIELITILFAAQVNHTYEWVQKTTERIERENKELFIPAPQKIPAQIKMLKKL